MRQTDGRTLAMSFASWLPKRNLKGKHAKVPLGCVAVCGAAVAISGGAAGLVLCGLRAWRLARWLAGCAWFACVCCVWGRDVDSVG